MIVFMCWNISNEFISLNLNVFDLRSHYNCNCVSTVCIWFHRNNSHNTHYPKVMIVDGQCENQIHLPWCRYWSVLWLCGDKAQPCYLVIFSLLLLFWGECGNDWKIDKYLKFVCVCFCPPVSLTLLNYDVVGFQPQAVDIPDLGSVHPPK